MIWSVFYWVLLVLAIVVGVRALFWDRAGFRGRAALRCRKCWYDLTGANGDLRIDPIVCPECGKKHASRRSMRKTRRLKKLILISFVFFIGSYVIQIRHQYNNQKFQRLGWPVLVPTPALIVMIPFLSDEPGSKPDRHSGNNFIPIRQYPLGERITHQLMVRMYEPGDTGLTDRWLFSWFAQHESWAVLTDESSVRGQMYTYVYRALARQRRLNMEEEHWARSVYWMDLESPESLPQMSPVHVRIREFRRLLDEGSWRVQIGKTLFEPIRRSPDFVRKLRFVEGENAYHEGYVRIADFVRWPNVSSTVRYEDLAVRGRIYEGEPEVDLWWPVGVIEDSVRVDVVKVEQSTSVDSFDEIGGVDLVDDEETAEWIQDAVNIDFVWERRFQKEGDIPIGLKMSVDEKHLFTDIPGFTFGGTICLHCKTHGSTDLHSNFGYGLFMSEPIWWALRDDHDQGGRRILDGNWVQIAFKNNRTKLSDGALGYRHAEGISEAWFEIKLRRNTLGEGNFAPLWDLDAKRVFSQTIKVPLNEYEIKLLEGACRAALD